MRRENPRPTIAHIMAPAHSELVEKLQATKLAGPTFRSLAQRHEMNIHPEKEEPAPAPSSPTHGALDMSEDAYFNADDDDDDVVGPQPLVRVVTRRRGDNVRGGAAGGRPRVPRPQAIAIPRTPPIGSLVDYSEEEEEGVDLETSAEAALDAIADGLVPVDVVRRSPGPGEDDMPPRPGSRLAKRAREEDDEDDALDRLAGLKPTSPTSPGVGAGRHSPFRPEKRRRENGSEPESTDFVKGLIAKATTGVKLLSKTLEGDKDKEREGAPPKVAGTGPRRIKLKLGAGAQRAASTEPGAKDGDTG